MRAKCQTTYAEFIFFLIWNVCFTREHSFGWNCEVKRVMVRLYGKYAKFDIQDIGRGYRASGELFILI